MLSPKPGCSEGEPPAATLLLQDCGCPAQRFPGLLLLGDPQRPQSPAVPRSEACAGVCTWCGEGGHCLQRVFSEISLGLLSPGTPGRSSSPTSPVYSSSDTVSCRLTHTVPCAHQKPITALKAAAGRLVTGSQDHTLRVRVGSISWVLGWPAIGGQAFRVSQGEDAEGISWPKCKWEAPRDQNLMPTPAPGVPSGGLVLPLHPAGPLRGHHNCVH